MSGKKAHPEKADESLARLALARAKDAGSAYSQYIVLHYRATGNLAPGLDAKDLIAYYQTFMPQEWAAKGGKP